MMPAVASALTEEERLEALEAARWYVTGVVSELSTRSIGLIARLALVAGPQPQPPRQPRVLTAVPHSSRQPEP